MRFVFDENLPSSLPKAMAAVIRGHSFAHSTDLLGAGATDQALFAALAADPLSVLVTQDRKQTRTAEIRAALRSSGVTVVFLAEGWMKLSNVKRAELLFRWWPFLEAATTKASRGAWFDLPSGSRLLTLKAK